MKKQGNMYVKRWTMMGLAVVMLSAFSGCGSTSKFDESITADTKSMQNAASADFAYGTAYDTGEVYEEEYAAEEMAEEVAEGASESGNAEEVQDTGRKLIKNVDMSVETQDFDGLLPLIEEKVAGLGGYIENSSVYNGSTYRTYKECRSASLTIRIPQEQLEGFIKDMQGVSNVTSCNRSVQDVTLTYVDLESHKKALQVEQDRLLELLEVAANVEDIITIESRLSQVRYEIESMESQLRSYDNQVDYSTVYMNIEEVEVLTPVAEETTGERIVHGFTDSVKDVGKGIKEFFVELIIRLPYIVEWVIIVAVVIFIIVKLARRSMRKKSIPESKSEKAISQNEQNERNHS